MEKKSKCCKKKCDIYICCSKYPKCCCNVNKCAPIYYPNNYPCNPCNSYNPCTPPITPTSCYPTYTTYNSIISGDIINFNLLSTYTLFIVNPIDDSGLLYLPAITSLGFCLYNKHFIISNISNFAILLNPSLTSTTTDNINGLTNIIIQPKTSVNVYSSYINKTTGYWCLI
jgi:hypothetical protein